MYLHIGGDVVVTKRNIVAILNMESSTLSKETRGFLKAAEGQNFIKSISEGNVPKSIIIVKNKKNCMIYLSPISTFTLKRRASLNIIC